MRQAATGMVFRGPVPTDIDVGKLRARWPEHCLIVGQVVLHSDIETLLNLLRDTNRYRNVVKRWRDRIESETGHLILGAVPGIGYRVLDNRGKIDLADSKIRTAGKYAHRAHTVIAARLDFATMTQAEKDQALFAQRRSAAMIQAEQNNLHRTQFPRAGALPAPVQGGTTASPGAGATGVSTLAQPRPPAQSGTGPGTQNPPPAPIAMSAPGGLTRLCLPAYAH